MRVTIDLPDDLHQQALSIARDTSHSLNETVVELLRRGLGVAAPTLTRSRTTGLPVVRLCTVITADHMWSPEDES